MAAGLHISISAEKVAQIGPLVISNSILTSLVVSALMIAGAFYIKSQIRPSSQRPSAIQNIFEMIIEGLYNLVLSVTGSDKKNTRIFSFGRYFLLLHYCQ